MNQHTVRTIAAQGTGPGPGAASGRPLLVVAVPAGHPYPRHILAEPCTAGSTGAPVPVEHRADEIGATGNWWPPAAIDPRWIGEHSHGFDLLHLHFGTESFSLDHLRDTVAALEKAGRPLVFTVHDLSNPQLVDQAGHRAQLALLLSAATAVITLTAGAAAEIERHFGRRAMVIPHPHVLPLTTTPPRGATTGQTVIGLSLKDFRPNVAAVASTEALIAAVRALRASGADIRVAIDHHSSVRDRQALAEIRRLAAAADFVTVWEHPRLEDDALVAYLVSLDACVLPYRHGTHSGWLELCWDLGVAVVAPTVGYFAQQHPDAPDIALYDPERPESLAEALRAVLAGPTAASPGSAARTTRQETRRIVRRAERKRIAEQHAAVYQSAVDQSVLARSGR